MRILLNVHELAQQLSGMLDNAKSKRGTFDTFQLSPTEDGKGVVAIRQYATTRGRAKTVRASIASGAEVLEPLDRPFQIPMHYLTGWLDQADGDVEQVRMYADTDKLRGSLEYETEDGNSGVVELQLYEVEEGEGLPTEEPDTVCDPRELASMEAYTSEGDPKHLAIGFVLLSSGLAMATDCYCVKYRPVKSEYDGLVTLDGHPATDCGAKFPNVLGLMPLDTDLGKGVRLSKSIAPVLKRWLADVRKANAKRKDKDYGAYVRLEVTDGQLDVRCPTAMARNVYQIVQDAESEGYVVNFGIRQLLRLMADPDMEEEFTLASTGSRGRQSAIIQRNATWLQATYTVNLN